MDTVVVGNATLDVICQTVDEVPRYESIAFDNVVVSPGGCGSNVALGLAALGVPTAIVARLGQDDTAGLVLQAWRQAGLELQFVRQVAGLPTGTSVGLVDSQAQPRFIHTTGANATLVVEGLDPPRYASLGARFLHIAGYFVLPGLYSPQLAGKLAAAKDAGLTVSLDVVRSPRLARPEPLWPCLPYLDVLLCNAVEAQRLSGEADPKTAARALRARGAAAVIIKLGGEGCWLDWSGGTRHLPARQVPVVDTTGAGDAFAAGLVAARSSGADLVEACEAGNRAGERVVGALGAVSAWLSA